MKKVQLVGILNVTPDSFSDGGLYEDPRKALGEAERLFKDGASIIDVGGESTNPRSIPITPDEEWRRIKDILAVLIKKYPGKISVDSHHPETLRRAAEFGPFIINDVTGFNNPVMVLVTAELQLPVIISHLPAKFGTDIQAAHASHDPMSQLEDVSSELLEREAALIATGVKPDNIILDPGIGFGKTMELNAKLVDMAKYLPGKRVMIGYSRKRFLGENRMDPEPNIAAGKRAIAAGAAYLRVHDVKAHSKGLRKLAAA
ncbi:MAG TPA: dihydropteroate synthase [Candidatus Saccharimonadales bacterium]|nr:dihydropteroate synthase [Candidatus Saccharimonadales bacterium]